VEFIFRKKMAERKPGLWDALGTIKLVDLSANSLAEIPCARSAFISGLSSGFTLMTARALITSKITLTRESILKGGKWGVYTFALVSSISWEFCRYQRNVAREELAKMAQHYQNNNK
jgi:cytochrome c oxidase assembly protein subunit 20